MTYSIFISYRHKDAAAVDTLVAALEVEGLDVWIDRNEIDDAAGIQARIEQGLARSSALLAWYSADYPRSRACQWEITAALIAARADRAPVHRVIAINPEPDDEHIRPLAARNIQHFKAPGDAAGFAGLARRIAAVLEPIPGPLGALRRLAAPACRGNKLLGSNRFVGRVRDMWQIHDALARGDYAIVAGQPSPASTAQLAQVRGSGGIGKSMLAEEYALRFGAFWPGGIFWLRAHGNPDQPTESAAALAIRRAQEYSSQLAGFARDLWLDPKGLDDHALYRALARRLEQAGQPYLWIVDDLPDCMRSEMEAWLAPGRPGQTLVTTRSRRQDGVGHILALELLPKADARELLTRGHLPRPDESSAVTEVLRHLDGHALALDVARATCLRQGYANFLVNLANPSHDALQLAAELAPELPNGHNPSIAATFLAGFADLSPEGRDFLRLAAQLATAPVERELVATCFALADGLDAADAEHLADRGMQHALDRSLAEPAADAGTVTVHALIGRSLRFQDQDHNRQSALRQAAVRALTMAMRAREDIRAHGRLADTVVHARQLAENATDEPGLYLAATIGSYEYAAAHYAAARQWLQAAHEGLTELLGEDHPDTLASMNNLANTLYDQGDPAGALDLHNSALATQRRVLGEEHPATLASMSNLANSLYAQGDRADALDLQKTVLATQRRVLGEEHPATLCSMNNLGETLRAQGDLAGALELEKSVLATLRLTLGEDHPDALKPMSNLALTLKAQGDLAGALELEKSVLTKRCRVLGEDHPDTLTSRNNLAETLRTQGDLAGALELQKSVLATLRRVLGEEHPNTLTSMNNLAGTLKAQGDLAGALELEKSALAIRRRVLGEEHPDTLTSMNNLATTLYAQSNLAGALELEKSVLAIQRRVLGEEHPNTLASMNNLVTILSAGGYVVGALELQKSILATRRRVLGDEHPDTLTLMNSLAYSLWEENEYLSALEQMRAAAEGRARTLGPNHPQAMASRQTAEQMQAAIKGAAPKRKRARRSKAAR